MPAAAVAPDPMGNIKVVAVKKLVVGFRNAPVGTPQGELVTGLFFFAKTACTLYSVCAVFRTFTLKKLEGSKHAIT